MSDRFQRVLIPNSVEPACPAALRVAEGSGGSGAICRITTSLIESKLNPSTLTRFCFDCEGYRTCPTWRADKEEFWATKTIRDLLGRDGDRVGGHPEDRERNRGLEMARDAQERDRWTSAREQS